METGGLAVAALFCVVLGYIVFVNRPRQRYVAETVFDAPSDAVWRLHDIRPGQSSWVPQLTSCEWVDEDARDMRLLYENGTELRMRTVGEEPGRFIAAEARMRPGPDVEFGDVMTSRAWITTTEDGRTRVRNEIDIERRPAPGAWISRLGYPWLMPLSWRMMRRELVASGHAPAPPPRPRALVLGGQVALVTATLASFMWLVGVWAGLGLLVMLVTHEYGHVWAMRRHGHETARFYLIPFFGGVAIGSRAFRSEAEAVEIFLAGPVFGLAPSFASLGVFALTDDPFWASLAGFLAIVNGLNLAPMPPLDGGRVTQSLLRIFGDKAWYAGSGLLLLTGAAVSAYFRIAGLLAVAVVGALAWGATPKPHPQTKPLSAGAAALGFAVFLGLIAIHALIAYWALTLDGDGALEAGPAFAASEEF